MLSARNCRQRLVQENKTLPARSRGGFTILARQRSRAFVPIWNVILSMEFWSPYKPATFAGLCHYREMLFYDDAFWRVMWNTLVVMASAPVGSALATSIALLVDTKIPSRNIYRTIAFMSYPVMTVVVGIINSFTAFDLIFVMTGGGPGHATDLLVTYIYSTAFRLSKFDYAAAITVVNFLLFVLLAFIANRLAGGEAGAIKSEQ